MRSRAWRVFSSRVGTPAASCARAVTSTRRGVVGLARHRRALRVAARVCRRGGCARSARSRTVRTPSRLSRGWTCLASSACASMTTSRPHPSSWRRSTRDRRCSPHSSSTSSRPWPRSIYLLGSGRCVCVTRSSPTPFSACCSRSPSRGPSNASRSIAARSTMQASSGTSRSSCRSTSVAARSGHCKAHSSCRRCASRVPSDLEPDSPWHSKLLPQLELLDVRGNHALRDRAPAMEGDVATQSPTGVSLMTANDRAPEPWWDRVAVSFSR